MYRNARSTEDLMAFKHKLVCVPVLILSCNTLIVLCNE